MNTIIAMAAGAACVGLVWLGVLTIKHGWGWVLAKYHARVAKAEAAFQAEVSKALPAVLAPINADIALIKQKLGIAPAPVPQPAAAPVPPAPPAAA
jgi:hypothetical protein